MQAIEHQIVEMLSHILNAIGWPGVVVIMALESANIPIPSEVTMPLAGWMLVLENGMSQWEAFFWGGFYGALGCTIGSLASYFLGAYGGRPFLYRYGKYFFIHHSDLETAERWFARWGDWVAFFSRLLPIVRTFVSFPLGVVRMRLSTFTLYTFIGSFFWTGALAWGGWHFGARWEELRALLRPFDIPIAIAIVAGMAWYIWHHVKRFKEAEAAHERLAAK